MTRKIEIKEVPKDTTICNHVCTKCNVDWMHRVPKGKKCEYGRKRAACANHDGSRHHNWTVKEEAAADGKA